MDIKIQSIHFDADVKLEEFISSKIEKLVKFNDRLIDAEVFLKLDKSQNTENKVAEIRLGIAGNDLFAKSQKKTFEEAVDNTIEALKKQIIKKKEKLQK